MKDPLPGIKTYIMSGIIVLGGIIGLLAGKLDAVQAMQWVSVGLAFAALRNGIKKADK